MSTEVLSFLFSIVFMSMIVNTALALYGVLARPSLVKKIIALTILGDSANTFAIMVGFRQPSGTNPIPPVLLWKPTPSNIRYFISHAVDPLPQALVLTAIVIGLAVTLFLVFLTIQIYRQYGTTDVRKVAKLRG
ncbi:MAG: Na+/H+ antiporter subunit C [Crenarchaeota archaeon]|nr:Na+/H+ antiporter subunit C [Thermoproteota archaeon]